MPGLEWNGDRKPPLSPGSKGKGNYTHLAGSLLYLCWPLLILFIGQKPTEFRESQKIKLRIFSKL